MEFIAPAESYDRFMGRYSRLLAPVFVDFAGTQSGMHVLDVGSGPGALAEHLAMRLGASAVAAADPSEPFVQACARRIPDADVRKADAEVLPWESETFDAVLSQLVINFVTEPSQAVQEMRRVAKSGGVVAACVWDYREGMEMLRTFWDAAVSLDPDAPTEGTRMRYCTPDELRELWVGSDLVDVSTGALEVALQYRGFDDFWEPFTAGVGPAGAYCASLADDARARLREECRRRLGDPRQPPRLRALAWAVRGLA